MLFYIFSNVSGIKPIPAKQQKINNRALNIKAEMAENVFVPGGGDARL